MEPEIINTNVRLLILTLLLIISDGTDQCFNHLPASGLCNILVTDLDAVDSIDATPAVKYTDIIVVGPSSTTGSTSVYHTTTTSPDTDMATVISYQQSH